MDDVQRQLQRHFIEDLALPEQLGFPDGRDIRVLSSAIRRTSRPGN